jgi:hypothetical protein
MAAARGAITRACRCFTGRRGYGGCYFARSEHAPLTPKHRTPWAFGVFSRPRENTSCPFTDYPLWNGFSVHVGCLALRYAYSEPSVVCCRTGSEACYPYILSIVGGKIEDFLALLLLIPTAWVTRVRVCEGCYIFTGY